MSTTFSRRAGRTAAAAVAASLGLTALAVSPVHADTQTHAATGATATVADTVVAGQSIHLEGTGWTGGNNPADGSTIAVKLGSQGAEAGMLGTEPATGAVVNPGTGTSADDFDVWAAIEAKADGSFSADIPFPTIANTKPALSAEWAPGSTHTLTLLSGSLESGDTGRGVKLTFKVSGNATTAATSARGGAVSVSLSADYADGTFKPGEKVSARVNGVDYPLATAATATGALASRSAAIPAGVLPAGTYDVILTGDQGTAPITTKVTVQPAYAFSSLAQGASGTLTLSNLAKGATISAVTLPGATFAALPVAADATGTATVAYTIAANAGLGQKNLTVAQSGPQAATFASTAKISPDSTIRGADRFTITSSKAGDLWQGLYQSAFSAKQNALYVTAANSTKATETDKTEGWDGYVYKLDPTTLAVEKQVRAPFVAGDAGARFAPYGVGVDDVNGTVWVTNTRQNTVTVYDQDLNVLKTWASDATKPNATGYVSHARDVVADPAHGLVFVSSASEGSSGNGSIAVFEAGDKNGNGTKYEKLKDIAVLPRTDFSPMSLTLDPKSGHLFSVSLTTQDALMVDPAKIDATTATDDTAAYTQITLPELQLGGGRGASGVAYDAVTNRLFVASQNSDELLIAQLNADHTKGTTVKEIGTGAGALNVTFDAVNRLVYVANFGGTTVSVLDVNGTTVATLPIASANHLSTDGKGTIYAVNKAAGNQVFKLTYHAPTVTKPKPGKTRVQKARAAVKADKATITKLHKKLKKAHGPKVRKQLKKKLTIAKKKLAKDVHKLHRLTKATR